MNTIDKIYKLIKSKKKAKFDDIWKEIKKTKYENKNAELEDKNNIYTQLLIDHRFIMIQKNVWSIRELYSTTEIENIMLKNYDVTDVEEKIIEDASSFTEEIYVDLDSSFKDKED